MLAQRHRPHTALWSPCHQGISSPQLWAALATSLGTQGRWGFPGGAGGNAQCPPRLLDAQRSCCARPLGSRLAAGDLQERRVGHLETVWLARGGGPCRGHSGSRVEDMWEAGGNWGAVGGSGGQVRTTRGPHRGHMQDATWVRTGASGTMLGACGDHTRAYVGARGGKSWWGAPMLGSAEASRGVLGAGISPVHEGAPALRVTHPPQLEPSQLRPQPRRAERCCLHPVGPLPQAVGRRAPVSGARFRS